MRRHVSTAPSYRLMSATLLECCLLFHSKIITASAIEEAAKQASEINP